MLSVCRRFVGLLKSIAKEVRTLIALYHYIRDENFLPCAMAVIEGACLKL